MLSVQVRVPSQGQELVPIAGMDKNLILFPNALPVNAILLKFYP
ncbi:hypothetical protein [Paenibacillus gallinarum]|nr:hypothetical protein [Paenibacillus gallinarum]